jgi:hypothetical protein
LGSKAVRRRREKDDVGFCQIGKEAIRFTRPPIGLSHRPRDGSVVSFLHCMNDPQPEGHMASYIARRKFLATVGGAAAAWPLAARAQEERMRRIGLLQGLAESDPEIQAPHRGLSAGSRAEGHEFCLCRAMFGAGPLSGGARPIVTTYKTNTGVKPH